MHFNFALWLSVTLLGISVKTPAGMAVSKARLLMCSVDLPARAQVLNMKQFNGVQGCAYCEDESTARASSHLHRNWPYRSRHVMRTHTKMLSDAKEVVESGQAVRMYESTIVYTGLAMYMR